MTLADDSFSEEIAGDCSRFPGSSWYGGNSWEGGEVRMSSCGPGYEERVPGIF